MKKQHAILLAVISLILSTAIVFYIAPENNIEKAIEDAPVTTEASPVNPTANPDCQISPQSLNPLIDVKAHDVEKVIENGFSNESKLYIQHVVLKDNTHLEYTEGGCVHFSYEITIYPYTPSEKSTHVIARDALNEINTPHYLNDANNKIQMLRTSLDKVFQKANEAVDEEMKLECGDAQCDISVVENKMIISYDMAL